MKLSFGRQFEDLFAQVITSVRKRSLEKAYEPQQLQRSVRNSRYFIKQRPYPNTFDITNQTKQKNVVSPSKSHERNHFFNKTFTTFKNARYCLEKNPQRKQQYHIRNLTFDNPGRYSCSPKKTLRPLIVVSKQYNRKDCYEIKLKQENQREKLYENAIQLSDQLSMRNSQRLARLNVQKKKLKLKHTEGIQGWNSNQLEQDITQFLFKNKKG